MKIFQNEIITFFIYLFCMCWQSQLKLVQMIRVVLGGWEKVCLMQSDDDDLK